jgi:hypothetical protein
MSEIVPIITTKGVHPDNLKTSVREQQLYNEGRFRHLDKYNSIFVFGSNEAGYHGAGAARFAEQFLGAVNKVGNGPTGLCYALPTKSRTIRTLPLHIVQRYVEQFNRYAEDNPGITFKVTQVGCGLAGFTGADIAPFFTKSPSNCFFDLAWEEFLPSNFKFWGTVP